MTTPSPLPEAPEASGRLFLVWSPGGLVEGAEARLETALPNANATTLVTGLAWLSDTSAGHSPPRGFLFPIDLAYVEPTEYGRVTGDASLLAGLGRGRVVFSETGRRSPEEGTRVTLDRKSYKQSSVITDEEAQGYGSMLASPAPNGWGATFVLVRTDATGGAVRRAARPLSQRPIAVVREGDTPYLRYAHSTSPQARFKEVLGEFAARPRSDGTIEVDICTSSGPGSWGPDGG